MSGSADYGIMSTVYGLWFESRHTVTLRHVREASGIVAQSVIILGSEATGLVMEAIIIVRQSSMMMMIIPTLMRVRRRGRGKKRREIKERETENELRR